jgi:hypothetical protein
VLLPGASVDTQPIDLVSDILGWISSKHMFVLLGELGHAPDSRVVCRARQGSNLHFHALPKARRALVVPRIHNACSYMLSCAVISFDCPFSAFGGDVRLGETSSMLVAFLMLMASSDSCLSRVLLSSDIG